MDEEGTMKVQEHAHVGTRPGLKWLWPSVTTPEGAEWATKQAFWAAVLFALITAAFSLFGAAGVQVAQGLNFDLTALIDAVLFGLIAVGLWRRSRVAAWVGLLLYLFERAFMWSQIGVRNPVIAAIFILAFLGGVRGTSALHRMKHAAQRAG